MNYLADDFGIGSESSLPETVAKNHDRRRVWSLIHVRQKNTPIGRRSAQLREEVRTYEDSLYRLLAVLEMERRIHHCQHSRERLGVIRVELRRGIRHIAGDDLRRAPLKAHQGAGVGNGQSTQGHETERAEGR